MRKFSAWRSSVDERDGADLGHALDDVRDVLAELLADFLGRGKRVLDHVVQQAGGNADRVEFHVGQDVGDFQRVHEYGSPEWRICPLCSRAENTYARRSNSRSASGL